MLFASTAVAQLDPIVIKGSKFFYKTNGTQFFMKGVAYQRESLLLAMWDSQLTLAQRIFHRTAPLVATTSIKIPWHPLRIASVMFHT